MAPVTPPEIAHVADTRHGDPIEVAVMLFPLIVIAADVSLLPKLSLIVTVPTHALAGVGTLPDHMFEPIVPVNVPLPVHVPPHE